MGEGAAPLLRVENVELEFAALRVLKGVSVEVDAGEVVGLVGMNGAGKSSLLNCISGVYRPTAGRILLDGRELRGLGGHRLAGLGVGRTLQHVERFRRITVREFVLLGLSSTMRFGVVASALGVHRFTGEWRARNRAAEDTLGRLGLADLADKQLGELPYGVVKLADICRALVLAPRLIIMDEPTSGLTAPERSRVVAALRQLAAESPIAQIVVEHDMGVVREICPRMLVMRAGEIVADGATASVLAELESVAPETTTASTI